MTRKDIIKDFFKKTVLPVALAALLFTMCKPSFTKDGVTDYMMVWLISGIPFGIWRLRLWLIPRNFDIGGTAGIWALNFIIGGLIGGVIIVWRLLVAAWYLILTVYRLATYNNESNRVAREVDTMVADTNKNK
ncbi:MAG: DUF6050 family protein [Gracilibacteraceae bacterium]|jgi:hypothetical protein|nr:DUF6050 family protein [Gracilibacteraceae bacterium]